MDFYRRNAPNKVLIWNWEQPQWTGQFFEVPNIEENQAVRKLGALYTSKSVEVHYWCDTVNRQSGRAERSQWFGVTENLLVNVVLCTIINKGCNWQV